MNADPMPIRGPVALVGLAPPDLEYAHDAAVLAGVTTCADPTDAVLTLAAPGTPVPAGVPCVRVGDAGQGSLPRDTALLVSLIAEASRLARRSGPTWVVAGIAGGVGVTSVVRLLARRPSWSGWARTSLFRRAAPTSPADAAPVLVDASGSVPGLAKARDHCVPGGRWADLLPALPARPASRAQRSCLPRGRWARWRPGRRPQGGGGVPIDRRPPHRGRRTMEQRCGAMRSGHRSSRPRPRDQRRPGGRRRYGRRSLGRATALPGHHPRGRTSRAQPGTGPLRSHTDPARTEAPGEGPASAAPSPLGRFRHPRSGRALRAPSPPGRDCSCVTRCDSSPGAPPLPSPPQPPPAPDAARARRPAPSTPYERGSAE